jgi:cyclohexanone monooxygenase
MMNDTNQFVRSEQPYDAIVVGAGASGLYALYHLQKRGYNAMLIEAGDGVAGTWYWNRYPGLRVDVESVEYSYAFDDDLQQDWEWSERYAAQAELERYFNHVADRFNLRPSILLSHRVTAAHFEEATGRWNVETDRGARFDGQYCIMATGLLSAPKDIDFPDLDKFEGITAHTARWPGDGIDFAGKKVAVIGTGSSGIQVIPIAAETAEHLTVFQRTPAFAVPLRNGAPPEGYFEEVKANYAEWRRREKYESFGGWIAVNYKPVELTTTSALEASEEERLALYEDRWKSGGLAFYNVYPDIFADRAANDTLAEFLREKTRARINDPAVADILVPTDYPVMMRRLSAETNYYETFNRDNVTLVDARATPIQRFNASGLQTTVQDYDFDVVIFATGFDAMSGALLRIDVRGREGQTLTDHWSNEIRTTFGMMASGFPNMFYLSGPGSPAPLFQPVLFCEDQMTWLTSLFAHMEANGATVVDTTPELEETWVQECDRALDATLFNETPSWYVGGNIEGKSGRGLIYFGGIHPYREWTSKCASNGYAGLAVQ